MPERGLGIRILFRHLSQPSSSQLLTWRREEKIPERAMGTPSAGRPRLPCFPASPPRARRGALLMRWPCDWWFLSARLRRTPSSHHPVLCHAPWLIGGGPPRRALGCDRLGWADWQKGQRMSVGVGDVTDQEVQGARFSWVSPRVASRRRHDGCHLMLCVVTWPAQRCRIVIGQEHRNRVSMRVPK